MKRVLEIFGEPISIGGQESYVFNQIEKMNLDGLQIDCLTPYRCESELQRARVNDWGGKVYELRLPFKPGGSRYYIRRPLSNFLSSHKYDLIHIHSGSTSMLALSSYVSKKATGAKVIVHSHNAAQSMTIKKRLIRWLSSFEMESADVFCACSEEAAMSKFLPRVCNSVKIMHNGIDSRNFQESFSQRYYVRSKYLTDDTTFVLGHVGRMAVEKNHPFILQVFSELLDIKPNSELWFIGDGPERAFIEKQVDHMKLNNRVRLFGSRSDVESFMAAFDGFIFPSLFEGLPISLLEAQASGLHCFTNELVIHGCDIDKELVHGLSLNDDPGLWARVISSECTNRAPGNSCLFEAAGFDVAHSAKELEHLYRCL